MNQLFSKFLPVVVTALMGTASAAHAEQVTPSAAAGEKKAAMCIGCHGIPGYQASFPEVHKVPMIGGQGAKYIVAALGEYQKGDRKHPTMKAIAASLTEQDLADLAAFYEKQGVAGAEKTVPPAPANVTALLDKGKCVTCHGADFNTAISGEYPKLAGQHADYLYVALKAYQTTGKPNVGRANPTMQAQIQGFTHAELKLLANYLGSLKTDLTVQPQSRFR
ncbi:cytochrome c [Rhizobacter sp. Root1221]|uniref:c-type cytochrome n=1 Tax=Rhizobacter sp. Root1221 TaxID=1736433 RepID=UPI0006FA8CFE|nr:c-type cytochrome [Rhizobacter sp. Root1221]KQV98042.1 cytochrome C [Rhizobacter sp. Root1221]